MQGMFAVFRKELADHLGSRRFLILFVLILFAGLSSVYVAAQSIRDQVSGSQDVFLLMFTTSSGPLPPFFTFISFLGPLVGLALAFDSINGEQNRGTLSRLLAQPIYRDSVVNGKFLAALTTVGVMLASIVVIVSALGVWILGIIPTPEELLRVLAFLAVCVVYVGFWLALATTFSVLLRNTATAALAGIASWIFFTFFVTMIADSIANALVSVNSLVDPNAILQTEQLREMIARVSPDTLFQEATIGILMPQVRTLGPLLIQDVVGLVPNPLPLAQSLLLIWPQVVGLFALMAVCFAVAYVRFMTLEIRSL
ncbi:MAG: ABC transporter permease [Chloroflexi bacterium]|nr:ABC transporter permease [Chloroflexota bacterium]